MNKFAVIVAGVGGEQEYTKQFTGQAARLYDALVEKLGFHEQHTFLLTEHASGGPETGRVSAGRSTADEVKKALGFIRSKADSNSLVFVILIGHGSADTQHAKFNLVGPDLTAREYAFLLDSLPSNRVVFVNSASSSGEFIKPLSKKGRIIVTATRSGNEQNATTFAEHFIRALTSEEADADKNGRVSLLEAFNYATKQVGDWYKQQGRLRTEHALIDDAGDGVGVQEFSATQGALARTTYLDSKPIGEAGDDPELAKLLAEKQKIEEEIEKLRARKNEMNEAEYEAELERLLVELAETNQRIRSRRQ